MFTTSFAADFSLLACRRCGSALAGRCQARVTRLISGVAHTVDVYRYRCGGGRHVRRVVA